MTDADYWKAELATALLYLKQGKAKFTPNTTNSFVDDFLQKHAGLLDGAAAGCRESGAEKTGESTPKGGVLVRS